MSTFNLPYHHHSWCPSSIWLSKFNLPSSSRPPHPHLLTQFHSGTIWILSAQGRHNSEEREDKYNLFLCTLYIFVIIELVINMMHTIWCSRYFIDSTTRTHGFWGNLAAADGHNIRSRCISSTTKMYIDIKLVFPIPVPNIAERTMPSSSFLRSGRHGARMKAIWKEFCNRVHKLNLKARFCAPRGMWCAHIFRERSRCVDA